MHIIEEHTNIKTYTMQIVLSVEVILKSKTPRNKQDKRDYTSKILK